MSNTPNEAKKVNVQPYQFLDPPKTRFIQTHSHPVSDLETQISYVADASVYAELNREHSGAHQMAESHARNEAEAWLVYDTFVSY